MTADPSRVHDTIWFDELGDTDGQVFYQRNVTGFADGDVDSSPCGSGTCARLAALADEGRPPTGTVPLRLDSIIGRHHTNTRTARDVVQHNARSAVRPPQVTDMAYRTREHVFTNDPHDPLVLGVRAPVRYLDGAAVAASGQLPRCGRPTSPCVPESTRQVTCLG